MGIEEKKQPKIEVISEYSDIEKDIRDSDTFENKKEETLLDAKNLVDKIKQETNKKVEFIYSYSGAGESDKKKTEEIKSYTNDEIYKTLDELKVEIKTLEGKFKESGYVADREEIESKILEKEEKIRELEEEKGIKSSVGLAMKGNIAWDGSVKSQKISDITSKKEIKISELEKEIGDIEKENEEIAKNSPKGWLDSKVVENRKIQDEKKQEIEKLKEEPPKTEFKMEVDCAPMIKSKISESKDVNELMKADSLFHIILAKSSHNELFFYVLQMIRNELETQVYDSAKEKSVIKEAIAHHERILDAVKKGAVKQAKKAIVDHIKEVSETIERFNP